MARTPTENNSVVMENTYCYEYQVWSILYMWCLKTRKMTFLLISTVVLSWFGAYLFTFYELSEHLEYIGNFFRLYKLWHISSSVSEFLIKNKILRLISLPKWNRVEAGNYKSESACCPKGRRIFVDRQPRPAQLLSIFFSFYCITMFLSEYKYIISLK